MIGVVGNAEKVSVAKAAGAHHVVLQANFVEEVKALTEGRGVDVVYDSVGEDTFERSLTALRPGGTLVSFGQSSGKVGPIDVLSLGGARSLYLTRPSNSRVRRKSRGIGSERSRGVRPTSTRDHSAAISANVSDVQGGRCTSGTGEQSDHGRSGPDSVNGQDSSKRTVNT